MTTGVGMPAAASGELRIGDLTVRRLGFGAMRITGEGIWGPPDDRAAAIAVVRRAVDLGINLIDTADAYGPEVSEEILAEALHPYPAGLVIATKGGLLRSGPGKWHADCRPEHLRNACEASLRRLRLERIDLYQLHAVDPKVPIEDSLGELNDLRAEGKIRTIGVCNVDVAQLARGRAVAEIVTVQNRYNITERASEKVLDICEEDGIGFIPWFPLANGSLAKPGGALDRIAARIGATRAQIALAWLLHHSTVMLPIPGTASVAHLEENTAAATLRLDHDALEEIDALR